MIASGLVDVASHTYNLHDALDGRSPLLTTDPDIVAEDLFRARVALESRTGKAVRSFIYPHGGYNATVLKIVREAGYAIAFTGADHRPVRAGDMPLALPRYVIRRQYNLPLILATAR